MPTVTDAQNEANALSALISSLTGSNQDSVRPEIRADSMILVEMLKSLTETAIAALQATTGTTLDGLISWSATAESHLRDRVLNCITSAQPLVILLSQILAWYSGLETVEWNSPPPNLPIGQNAT